MSNRERNNHFMFELRRDKQAPTGKSVSITKPQDVLPIHDKEELTLQLEHYSRPFIKQLLPDSVFARRRYILYIRPALRYYCEKFSVSVPAWLKDDSYFEDLPPKEQEELFGTAKLRWNGAFSPLTRSTSKGQVHK